MISYESTVVSKVVSGTLFEKKGKGKVLPYCLPELIPVYRQSARR